MLYAITDKYDKPFGVHECPPKDILKYVRGLPRQGAPYITQPAMSRLHRAHSRMMNGSVYAGLFLGGPLYGMVGLAVWLLTGHTL